MHLRNSAVNSFTGHQEDSLDTLLTFQDKQHPSYNGRRHALVSIPSSLHDASTSSFLSSPALTLQLHLLSKLGTSSPVSG
jgi:hypothetical protein